MEFRELATFLEIAKESSFSRAAKNLGYSQAAVTIQIRRLEAELGVRLFDRLGKQVTLTHQGQVFSQHAARLMTDLAQAKYALSEPAILTGRLCIGAIESVCSSLFPPLLTRFHKLHPQVSVSLQTDSPSVLLNRLNRNALDIVYFLDKRMYDPKWVKAFEEPDQVIFIASPGHPLAGRQASLQEVIRYPMILTEKNASYRFILEQHLAAMGLQVSPFLEIGNTEFIIKLLLEGQGLSFLPEFTVRRHLLSGRLSQIRVPGFSLDIWKQIVYHKDKWVSREMEEFLRLAKEQGSQAGDV